MPIIPHCPHGWKTRDPCVSFPTRTFAGMREWLVTPEFLETYEHLTEATCACVDEVIRRVLSAPDAAWARHGRVVGHTGSAWIVEFACDSDRWSLYWTIDDRSILILVLLLRRHGEPKDLGPLSWLV